MIHQVRELTSQNRSLLFSTLTTEIYRNRNSVGEDEAFSVMCL